MSDFDNAKRDAADLAKLVNEDADVTTRYGTNPKISAPKAIRQISENGSAIIDDIQQKGDAAIRSYNITPAFDFANGFTIETRNQAGKDANGDYWIYNGTLPFTVAAGTVPSEPNYTNIIFSVITDSSIWGDRYVGTFASGFTYTSDTDVARGQDGKYYRYIGNDSYPVVVAAGTVASDFSGLYGVVNAINRINTHNIHNIAVSTGISAGTVIVDLGTGAKWTILTESEKNNDGRYIDGITAIQTADGLFACLQGGSDVKLSYVVPESSPTVNILDKFVAVAKLSLGATLIVDLDEICFENTFNVTDDFNGLRVVGSTKSGRMPLIHRRGVIDVWRALFNVTTSNTYFHNIYGQFGVEVWTTGTSSRMISYSAGAGNNNKIGHVKGAYWRLGVVMSQDTDEGFYLDIDKISCIYSGRSYSCNSPNTPSGNVSIGHISCLYSGFIDISAGSVDIGSITNNRVTGNALKKGSDASGGIINIGAMTRVNSNHEVGLSISDLNGELYKVNDVLTQGSVSATVVSMNRYTIYVKGVVGGVFSTGTVTNGVISSNVTTVSNISVTHMIANEGVEWESITVGTMTIKDSQTAPFELYNGGSVVIDKIVADNIYGNTHFLRWEPTAGVGANENATLTINTMVMKKVNMDTSKTMFYFNGIEDLRLKINNIDMTECSCSSSGYWFILADTFNINNVTMKSCSYASGIFSDIASGSFGILGDLYSNTGSNYLANVRSTSSHVAVKHIRHAGVGNISGGSTLVVSTDVVRI